MSGKGARRYESGDEAAKTVDGARVYPDTYYQQHRNSILFSLGGCLLSVPNVSINLNELLFIESTSRLATSLVHWGIWLAASYSTLHFYLEWRDHAKPHGQAIKNAVGQIRSDLQSMASELRALTTLDSSISEINKLIARFETPGSANDQNFRMVGNRLRTLIRGRFKLAGDRIKFELAEAPPDAASVARIIDRGMISCGDQILEDAEEMFRPGSEFLHVISKPDLRSDALHVRSVIEETRAELQEILAEPRWVKKQVNLEERWTIIRVWFIGFAPPLMLWITATVMFFGDLAS